MRTIGIVGRDFCGSTMLLRLFAAIERVEPVGELHWLIDAPVAGTKTSAGWTVTRSCVVCGKDCPVFTPEFVSSSHTAEDLYGDVAKQVGANTIVSADKLMMHYERFLKPGQLDAIVLYKSPQAQVCSDMNNEGRDFDQALALWSMTYNCIIDWCANAEFPRSYTFVSYEELAANPRGVMASLCLRLGLAEPPDDLLDLFVVSQLKRRYHCIGCSPHSHRRGEIVVDKHWKEVLTEQQKALCTNGQAAVVLRRLQHLSGIMS